MRPALEQLGDRGLLLLRSFGVAERAVRAYAHLVDAGAARRQVVGGGQLDGAGAEAAHLLHRRLAVGLLAEQEAAPALAEGGGQDLRRRRRTAVDQDHDRHRGIHDGGGGAGVMHVVVGVDPGVGGDDHAAGEEVVGHLHHRPEQPARIAAQVDDQRLGAVELTQRLLHPFRRKQRELHNAQVADPLADHAGAHRFHLDHLAFHHGVELDRCIAPHGKRHRGAGRSAQPGNDVGQVEVVRRLAVDRHDQVAGAHPGPVCRVAFDRGDHLETAVRVLADVHSDAAELAAREVGNLAHVGGLHVGGVWIVERVEHALQGAVEQRLRVEALLVHVVLQQVLQHLGKHFRGLARVLLLFLRHGARRRREQEQQRHRQRAGAGAAQRAGRRRKPPPPSRPRGAGKIVLQV